MVLYNPMSLVAAGRLSAIAKEFEKTDLVLLPGTRYRAQALAIDATPVQQQRLENGMTAFHWGWRRAPYSNRHAGCSILLGRRFLKSRVKEIFSPPASVQGRDGGVRIKSGVLDLAVLVAYFPPRPPETSKQRVWIKTAALLIEWMLGILRGLPLRCSCFVGTDNNTGFGQEAFDQDSSGIFGGHNAGVQNEVGNMICDFLRPNELAVLDTFRPLHHTFFGTGGHRSRPDHIYGPRDLGNRARLKVLWRSGRRLQLIPDKDPRDHYPMLFECDLPPANREIFQSNEGWCADRLAAGLAKGRGREEFFKLASERIKRENAGLTAVAREPTADHHWQKLVNILREEGLKVYGAKAPTTIDEKKKSLQMARTELLEAQAASREKFGGRFADRERLEMVSRQLKSLNKKAAAKWREDIDEEIHEAHRAADFARVHRLMAKRAGTGIGVKKRFYKAPSAFQASREEWLEELSKPGCLGGLRATTGSFEHMVENHIAERPPLERLPEDAYPEDWAMARKDVDSVGRFLAKCKRRKSCPEWSCPAEFFLMILRPKWISSTRAFEGQGVGIARPEWNSDVLRDQLVNIHLHVRAANWAPLLAHKSRAWILDKRNSKKGVKSLRVIHGLCPWWRHFFRAAYCSAPRWIAPPYLYGGIPGRRREGAILSAMVTCYRARRAKKPFLLSSKDLTNAFGSTSHALLDKNTDERLKDQDPFLTELFHQRRDNSTSSLTTFDGELEIQLGDGGLMGDGNAVEEFLVSYQTCVAEWGRKRYREESRDLVATTSLIEARNGGSPLPVDLSIEVFVDDLLKLSMVEDGRAATAKKKLEDSNSALDEAIAPGGFAQNVGKQESLIHLPKKRESKQAYKPNFLQGRALRVMLYLGVRLTASGNLAPELQARLEAMKKGWCQLGAFWHSPAAFALKRLAFIVKIQNAGLSGLEAAVLSAADQQKLDAAMVCKLRSLLRGKACNWATEDHPTAWSAKRVWQHWRLAPSGLELKIRRIKWAQEMVRDPVRHAHTLSAIFGVVRFDQDRGEEIDQFGKPQPGANAWAHQFYNDICDVAADPEMEAFDEEWEGSLFRLFSDQDSGKLFLDFDPGMLRRRFLTKSFAPPGWINVALPSSLPPSEGKLGEQHVCLLKVGSGEICGELFDSRMTLLAHQRGKEGGEHGYLQLAAQCVITNCCPLCSTTFASKAGAQEHLRRALRMGRCLVDNVWQIHPVEEPQVLACHLCQKGSDVFEGDSFLVRRVFSHLLLRLRQLLLWRLFLGA